MEELRGGYVRIGGSMQARDKINEIVGWINRQEANQRKTAERQKLTEALGNLDVVEEPKGERWKKPHIKMEFDGAIDGWTERRKKELADDSKE